MEPFLHPSVFAAKAPDRVAYQMVGSGEQITYGQLEARSNQLAHLFRSLGLMPGDHLALMLENHPRYFEICWAAQRSGLIFTALSSRLSVGEAAYIITDCQAKLFITSRAMAEVAAQLLSPTQGLAHRFMLDAVAPGYEALEPAAAAQPTHPVAQETAGGDMLYSSGTTGRPKGVFVPPESTSIGFVNSLTKVCMGPWGVGEGTRYLSPGPLYHAAPLRFCMRVMALGGTVMVMEQFDAEQFLACIERFTITHTQVVPTMFVRALKLDAATRAAYRHDSLQCVIHAAAPCPVPVKEQMIEWWGPVIWEYYAGTEGMGMTLCNSAQWLAHKGTVGKSVVGQARICGEEGQELPVGEVGAVYFSDGRHYEYHNDPEKTAGAKNALGWTSLGDIGRLDEDGFLYLTDRKAFMIISGGVNIYPQEAENVIVTHPQVMDVAVFGVPHEEMGEEVKAVVQPRDMAQAGPELAAEIIAFCRSQLAHFKCPRSVDFRAELPRHPTGKLYKRLLRDEYWAGRGESRIL
jgi:long-chain acyl-CoA synthetase